MDVTPNSAVIAGLVPAISLRDAHSLLNERDSQPTDRPIV